MRDKVLVNTWGRRLDLTHAKLDGDTYRRAYAFRPQSEVGALLMQYGLRPMWRWLKDHPEHRARIAMQLYDALYVCVPWESVWPVAVQLRAFLERPRVYYGQPMTIPVTTSVSWRWGGKEKVEWKKWPEAEELTATARDVYNGRDGA